MHQIPTATARAAREPSRPACVQPTASAPPRRRAPSLPGPSRCAAHWTTPALAAQRHLEPTTTAASVAARPLASSELPARRFAAAAAAAVRHRPTRVPRAPPISQSAGSARSENNNVKKERMDTQAGTTCGLAQSQAVPGSRTFKLSREIGALHGLMHFTLPQHIDTATNMKRTLRWHQ